MVIARARRKAATPAQPLTQDERRRLEALLDQEQRS
jgi:hypothetical protein